MEIELNKTGEFNAIKPANPGIGSRIKTDQQQVSTKTLRSQQILSTKSVLHPTPHTVSNVPLTDGKTELSQTKSSHSKRLESFQQILNSPLLIAWALALTVTGLIVVLLLKPSVRFQPPSQPSAGVADAPPKVSATPTSFERALDADIEHTTNADLVRIDLHELEPVDANHPANVPHEIHPMRDETENAPNETHAATREQPNSKEIVEPSKASPKRFDFEVALSQRLLLFDQSKPTSRRLLLEQLEEMLAIPVRYNESELGAKDLEKQVTFKLENASLRGVLKAIIEPAGWEYTADEAGITIRNKKVSAPIP